TVLTRALAGDPAHRFQTARELGHALNDVLFHIGRAVSSFDIAQLVLPIWRERVERKRRELRDKGSVISSMIDEAMLAFTSMPVGDRPSSPQQGSQPLSIGSFGNAHDWGDNLGLELGQNGGEQVSPESYELGNLAALEDDDEPPLARVPTPPSSEPAAPLPSSMAPPTPGPLPAQPAPPTSGGKGGMIALLVFLAVAAGLAGAYFGGVLPIAH
ncbi:MAG TPA: hypothetical protein VGP93_05750, partial [Polyangiaceae bacterium]|nr:hypothetical protein [Polyangiaceae bacterium]